MNSASNAQNVTMIQASCAGYITFAADGGAEQTLFILGWDESIFLTSGDASVKSSKLAAAVRGQGSDAANGEDGGGAQPAGEELAAAAVDTFD